MSKADIFLGACIAIYAIFSYLEAKLVMKFNEIISKEFLNLYGDEVSPAIVDSVSTNLTEFLKDYLTDQTGGDSGGRYKKKISKARKKNN